MKIKNDEYIIQTKNLSKKYKHAQLYSIYSLNISIKKGVIYGILGPNGAGKTTTLSIISGLLKKSSGEILYSTNRDYKDIRGTIGYVPQEIAVYSKLTARENLDFFGNLYSIKKEKLKKKISELLELTGLENRADDLIENYSTGMKRRINLALGLLHDPEIILLDEPTVGIDPQSRNCIFEAILKLKKGGTTILYSTHYMEEASKLCDIVAIMDKGVIILEGNPKDLVKNQGKHKIIFELNSKYNEDFINTIKSIEEISNISVNENQLIISSANSTNNLAIAEMIDQTAKKKKVEVLLVKIEEPDLENLFLDLTGRKLRDNDE
jgi:ABC-2 type transport system ATP-binding protein